MASDIDQLLTVMEDARLEGNAAALARLGRELTEQLGVSEAGGDEYGLWCRFEVTGADGDVASQRMRWLWPGRFVMGSPDDEVGRFDREGPQHEVVVTAGLWLGDVPVTQALYTAVTDETPSSFKGADRPVEQVSFDDCQQFCERLSHRFPVLQPRLPSEAQWEFAARAGTTTATYNGDLDDEEQSSVLDVIAWYHGNSGVDGEQRTQLVGQLLPNAWGCYDMLGNVWEWCEDRTDLGPYEARTQYDPRSSSGPRRVVRGGSWDGLAHDVRAAFRYASEPDRRYYDLGFRLAGGPAQRSGAGVGGAEQPRDGAPGTGASSEP